MTKTIRWPWLWILLAAAVLVRLPFLSGSLWLDEAAQALESVRPLSLQLQIAADFQPPLYHIIVHFLSLFSQQEWWLRLASLIPAVLSVWLTVHIARHWVGEKAALVAGAVVAFSGLHIFFSQELRPYSLAVLWALLSWEALETKRWRWLALTVAGGLYTSYVFLFWPIGLLATAWLERRLRAATAAVGVGAVFFLAWLPSLWEQLQVGAALRQVLPGWDQVVSLPQLQAILLTGTKFLVGVLRVDASWRDGILVGGTLVLIAYATLITYRRAETSAQRTLWRTTLFLIVPFFSAWLFSFFTPVIQPKRVLFLLPALAVVLGWLWERGRTGRLAVALFFIWQAVSLAGYWTQPALQREDWRGAITQLEERFSPENTAIIFGFSEPFAPWTWYSQENFPTFQTGIAPVQDLTALRDSLRGVERYRYVIVFDYLRDLTDPYSLIESYLDEAEYVELGAYTYPNLGIIHVFEQNQLYAGVEHDTT